MLKLLFGGFGSFLDTVTWVVGGVALIVFVVSYAIRRIAKVPLPIVAVSQFWSGVTVLAIGALKLSVMVAWLLTAQAQITKLANENKNLENQVETLEENAKRKEDQTATVVAGDRDVDIRYVPQYRTIETLREVPDLTLANRLALELTTGFYKDDTDAK